MKVRITSVLVVVVSRFCRGQFVSAQLLLHDCDAGRGASGGPLIDAETGSRRWHPWWHSTV